MRKILLSSLVLFLFTTQGKAQAKMDAWTELKSFHLVMSQTFHPSEEGNLEPIRKRAGEMKEKATALAASKIPADFNNEKVKSAVERLKEGAIQMDKMVAEKAGDKEVTEYLAGLHDIFHEIVGLCSAPDKKQE